MDAVTAAALGVASLFALVAWRLGREQEEGPAWLAVGVGLGVLAADELFNLQEWAHIRLHALGFGDPPYLNGIDDLILLMAGTVAVVLVLVFRGELARDRRVALLLASAGTIFAAAFALDAFGSVHGAVPALEEVAELGAAILTAAATQRQWAVRSGVAPDRASRRPLNSRRRPGASR